MNSKLELEQIKIWTVIRTINFRIKHHKNPQKPLQFFIAVEQPTNQKREFRQIIQKCLFGFLNLFLDRVLKVICQSEIVIMDAIIIILIYNAESDL